MSKICMYCGRKLEKIQQKKFCSNNCKFSFNNKRISKFCLNCNKQIFVKKCRLTRTRYCSKICTAEGLTAELLKFTCKECQAIFYRKPHQARRSSPKFCSVKCLCINNNKKGTPFIRKNNTKPERDVKAILDSLEIEYIPTYYVNYKNIVKFYDIYIPSLNLLIEVDGIYWHGKDVKIKDMNTTQLHNHKNDLFKNKIAKKLGFNLQRIWSDEISENKIKELLSL